MSTATRQRKLRGTGRDPVVVFRAPQDVVDAIRCAAQADNTTVSELIRSAVTEHLGRDPETGPLPPKSGGPGSNPGRNYTKHLAPNGFYYRSGTE